MSAARPFDALVLRTALSAALACSAGACAPRTEPPAPGPVPTEAPVPSAPPAVDSPAEAPTPAPPDFARRVETVPGTRAGQVVLADLLLDAMERDEPADVEAALRVLGRRLSEYRADRYEAVLVHALQRLSAAELEASRRRIDGRFVIPAAEVLLDVRDRAAIERLAASYADSPATPMLDNARELAASFPDAEVSLDATGLPETCTPVVDGRIVGRVRIVVARGSHSVGCDDGDRSSVEVSGPAAALVLVGDAIGVAAAAP